MKYTHHPLEGNTRNGLLAWDTKGEGQLTPIEVYQGVPHRGVPRCTEVYRGVPHRGVSRCTEVYRGVPHRGVPHRGVPRCIEVYPIEVYPIEVYRGVSRCTP